MQHEPGKQESSGPESQVAGWRHLPSLPRVDLRTCQIEALDSLERAFAEKRTRVLVQMAAGSGKTAVVVSAVSRLLMSGRARRVLLLVDNAHLGRQALAEFQRHINLDDGRAFVERYAVQHLRDKVIRPETCVCICTIQRLYTLLGGKSVGGPGAEDASLFALAEAEGTRSQGQVYGPPPQPAMASTTFDAIFIDECYPGIYDQWQSVLTGFNALIVGLTATPESRALRFFEHNLVLEYTYERAVAEGVSVDHQAYRVRRDIRTRRYTLEPEFGGYARDWRTREERYTHLDANFASQLAQLPGDAVADDQIRPILQAWKAALPTTLFPERLEVPRTLIFARDEQQADEIVRATREIFAREGDFVQKISATMPEAEFEGRIQAFRGTYQPRIVVAVQALATGTDIPALEVVIFMHAVRERVLFEQMKGRGSRVIADDEFRRLAPDALSKTHFVLLDAIGITDRNATESPALESKSSSSLTELLTEVAHGICDDERLTTLAGRLGLLSRGLRPDHVEEIAQATGGLTLSELAAMLIAAVEPEKRYEAAQLLSGQAQPSSEALRLAQLQLITTAITPFDNPDLQAALLRAQQATRLLLNDVGTENAQHVKSEALNIEQARQTVARFYAFVRRYEAEIANAGLFPRQSTPPMIRQAQIVQFMEGLAASPANLTIERVWQAYQALDASRVRGATLPRTAADLITLIRYTLERNVRDAAILEPFATTVQRRFAVWKEEQERLRGASFTPEQVRWLELVRDHLGETLTIEPRDLQQPLFAEHGGLERATLLFGTDLNATLQQLTERLILSE